MDETSSLTGNNPSKKESTTKSPRLIGGVFVLFVGLAYFSAGAVYRVDTINEVSVAEMDVKSHIVAEMDVKPSKHVRGDSGSRGGDGLVVRGGSDSLNTDGARESLCISGHVAPTFFMPGCQKCGTTSFWTDVMTYMNNTVQAGNALNTTGTHYWSSDKEKHFFDHWYFDQDLPQYWELYPECVEDEYTVTLDFTPNYMFEESVPKRIANAYYLNGTEAKRRIKIFFLLREPVARMQSYYYADCTSSQTEEEAATMTFGTYIDWQLNKSYACSRKDPTTSGWPPCDSVYNTTISQGLYGPQMELWLEYFRPEQIFVIPFQDYVSDPESTLLTTADVIGATMSGTVKTADDVNVDYHTHIGDEMSQSALEKIVTYYNASNQLVYDLIEKWNLTVLPGNNNVRGFLDYNYTSNIYPYGHASTNTSDTCVSEYSQCWTDTCCSSSKGFSCVKKDVSYSQCRTDCPDASEGWACLNDTVTS